MTTGNDFLDKLLDQTPIVAEQPKRGQNYNFPARLYLKPDGEVVSLQGDPINESYYRAKGYHLLNDQPTRGQDKSEVRQYVEDEYPTILEQQQEKARIINSIRRAMQNDRNLTIGEDGWEDYSVEDMRDVLAQIKEQHGRTITMIRPRASKPSAVDPMLRGVETTATTSMEREQERRRRGANANV